MFHKPGLIVHNKTFLPLQPNVHMRFLMITDFMLSGWFIIDSVPWSLHRVTVGSVADIVAVHTASILSSERL
jgi:hypothetical protein